MAVMISPEGEEHEVVDGGVAALEALGWELIEASPEPKRDGAEKPSGRSTKK